MKYEEQLKLIIDSKRVHPKWYREQYPDVASVGLHPYKHYFKYGAEMGRNPGKNFDTQFYVNNYPEAKSSQLNPVVFYHLYGKDLGHLTSIDNSKKWAKNNINKIKRKLYVFGFIERAIDELKELSLSSNKVISEYALRELAIYYSKSSDVEELKKANRIFDSLSFRYFDDREKSKLDVIRLVNGYNVKDLKIKYEIEKSQCHLDNDVLLALSNFEFKEDGKLNYINAILERYNITPISLIDSDCHLYDRLSVNNTIKLDKGSKVTVLIAAFNASETLPTTLRSLQQQSYTNLEILVLDDCSTDNTAEIVKLFSDQDSRIKLISMPENGGAYVARNHGLDIATGEFVTIHDADDWSHPDKIKIQINYLLDNEHVMGCTSQQARASNELEFTRWSDNGVFIITNTSSFMFRRQPVKDTLGYWDTVRFGADNELVRRIKKVFGDESVVHLETGPLSFQRDSDSSVVAHEFFGINGQPFGVRKEYLEAQKYYHEQSENLKYTGEKNKGLFAAPSNMRGKATLEVGESEHFDVIIASDFRMIGGSTLSNAEEIKAHKRAGLKTGLIQMYRYDLDASPTRVMLPEIRSQVDGEQVKVLCYGDKASCDKLILRYPPILQYYQKYIPQVTAKDIHVIVNQPPMSDYTPEGVLRYRLEDCERNIARSFNGKATWYPIGPLVRDALLNHHADELSHIELSKHDWNNIIDIDGWKRDVYQPQGKLKIGRHSRDHFVKWPGSKETLLAAYPEREDIEVHVLGGVKAPSELLGYTPSNWVVHDFGSVHPKDFLKEVDVYLYYSHPDWVEAFGRVIIEAMAVGVPVILPEIYKPLFKEAALYADEYSAVKLAQQLASDPVAYQKQVDIALKYANEKFSYQTHINRINNGF